jgi:two-component system sensor histidine kinase SenX3
VISPAAAALVALATLVVGLVVGGLIAEMSRRRARQPDEPEPVPIGSVLAALRAGAILLNPDLVVVEASPSSYSYRLVRGGAITNEDVLRLADAARRSSRPQEAEVLLERGRGLAPAVLGVRASQLSDGSVLVLAEDRTQAQRAEDARRDFVANISHELKTPIGALGLLAEAVEGAADDPEAVRRFATRMQHESSRLGRLVNEIIDLSRLQFDNPVESARAVSVDAVVAEVLDRVRSAAEAKHIRLVRGGPRGLEVIGDKSQLVTAINNLVDNAVAYSPEHTRVAVGVRERQDYVEITVSDQGIGIPESELDRIFERFYRVDPARSRRTGGTGLGLSIAKHIAAAHRGELTVWSVHGAGSTFTLRLPRHPVSHTPDHSPTPSQRVGADVREGTA